MFAELAAMRNMVKPANLDEYLQRNPMYVKTLEIDDKTAVWYVQDSRMGYNIFRDLDWSNTDTIPTHIKWISDKTEAIEFCYELAKKEIEELKSK